jgi:hypothetical protein
MHAPSITRRPQRQRRQREGAVLVEAVIVAAALVSLFGCVLVVQLYASLQLQKLDEAREEAWRKSMNGCGSEEPLLADMASELLHGKFPFPDGIVPSGLSASRTLSVKGVFSATGHKEIYFICNPRPGRKKPMTDMAGWVLELFS